MDSETKLPGFDSITYQLVTLGKLLTLSVPVSSSLLRKCDYSTKLKNKSVLLLSAPPPPPCWVWSCTEAPAAAAAGEGGRERSPPRPGAQGAGPPRSPASPRQPPSRPAVQPVSQRASKHRTPAAPSATARASPPPPGPATACSGAHERQRHDGTDLLMGFVDHSGMCTSRAMNSMERARSRYTDD
ncbi:atherin-like [Symphalangus syndactylus]|uniref:atherin-like n=1 Tax=Symphalangus syndactylus TaxID=9590 RepID=UPI0024424051|nr:atherin-like [Symphalangus syndactylus]